MLQNIMSTLQAHLKRLPQVKMLIPFTNANSIGEFFKDILFAFQYF